MISPLYRYIPVIFLWDTNEIAMISHWTSSKPQWNPKYQWPFNRNRLIEGPNIFVRPTFLRPKFQGLFQENMAWNLVLAYLHFRILKFPLIYGTNFHCWSINVILYIYWLVVSNIFLLRIICGRILPIDFHIFQRGRYTTNQYIQWEFQDPKLEVLYHIRPYFVGIFPYIGLI